MGCEERRDQNVGNKKRKATARMRERQMTGGAGAEGDGARSGCSGKEAVGACSGETRYDEFRIHELEAKGDVCGILALNWWRYQGQVLIGVDWNRYSHTDLLCIVRCVGGRVLARVCERLAEDYDVWGHGLPDLLFWRPLDHSALLVEVKVC